MLSEERLMEIQSLNAVDHHDTFRMSHTEYETYVGQLDDAVDDLLTEVDRLTATMKDMVPIDDCFLIRTDVQGATKPITCRQWRGK